ncbi:MAG: hypothetical protein KGL11_05695 [Alphaproteobacteria bacterium]|nr:hypothetical protein [Alphaproteobacteria bacterium]
MNAEKYANHNQSQLPVWVGEDRLARWNNDRWIVQRNIARFQRQLETESDERKRRAIEKMLAEEKARLKELDGRA